MPRGFTFRHAPLALALHLGLGLSALTLGLPSAAQSEATQYFDIPAGSLDQVLNRFALDAGIELYLDAALTQSRQSAGLQGSFSVDQGLQQLLANSGLSARQQSDGAWQLYALGSEPDSLSLAPLTIQTNADQVYGRDEAGHDSVYDDNISSVYSGKEQIERYKGANPADLFKGMLNVYTGDAHMIEDLALLTYAAPREPNTALTAPLRAPPRKGLCRNK